MDRAAYNGWIIVSICNRVCNGGGGIDIAIACPRMRPMPCRP